MALAATYVRMGREEEARAEVREVLKIHRRFTLQHAARRLPYKDRAVLADLRKAGLPD